jgi:phage tail tape-measure protein
LQNAGRSLIEFGREASKTSIEFDSLSNRMNAAFLNNKALGQQGLEYVKNLSEELGLSILDTSNSYAKFSASVLRSGLTLEENNKVFRNFSLAARSMQLSGEDMNLVFLALEQIVSKGIVSTEELRRQLGEGNGH